MNFKNKIRENFKGLIIILIAFLISANIAWLNPAPGKESYQPYKKIPILWQYNYDSGIEILTAAYFPKIFYKNNTRIDRPTYPFLANTLGKGICLIICHVYELNELQKAGIGYIILKLLIFSLALMLLNEILKKYLNQNEIFLSNLLIFFSIISIGNIAAFHTIELQFITPIIITFLFINLLKKYNLTKNFLFSIIVGILMLGKPNYAIYLTILVFSIVNMKIIETIISFICHLIPIFMYTIYLNLISLKLSITGFKYGQGTWLIQYLEENSLNELIIYLFYSLYKFIYLIYDNYSFWIVFSLVGIYILRKKINYNFYIFLIIFIFFTWLQIFISDRHKTYMTSDLMLVIYPLSSIGLFYFINQINYKILKYIIINVFFMYIFFTNIMAYVNFPLIHPYDQPSKNKFLMDEKMNELIN